MSGNDSCSCAAALTEQTVATIEHGPLVLALPDQPTCSSTDRMGPGQTRPTSTNALQAGWRKQGRPYVLGVRATHFGRGAPGKRYDFGRTAPYAAH